MDIAKVVLRGKFMALNTCIRKEKQKGLKLMIQASIIRNQKKKSKLKSNEVGERNNKDKNRHKLNRKFIKIEKINIIYISLKRLIKLINP